MDRDLKTEGAPLSLFSVRKYVDNVEMEMNGLHAHQASSFSWITVSCGNSSASYNAFTPLSILEMTSFRSIHLFIFILDFQHGSKNEQFLIRIFLFESDREPREERKQMMTSNRVSGQPGLGQWFTMSVVSRTSALQLDTLCHR